MKNCTTICGPGPAWSTTWIEEGKGCRENKDPSLAVVILHSKGQATNISIQSDREEEAAFSALLDSKYVDEGQSKTSRTFPLLFFLSLSRQFRCLPLGYWSLKIVWICGCQHTEGSCWSMKAFPVPVLAKRLTLTCCSTTTWTSWSSRV